MTSGADGGSPAGGKPDLRRDDAAASQDLTHKRLQRAKWKIRILEKKIDMMLAASCPDIPAEKLIGMSKSKDGQDLFVAVRSGFKRSGFFVEFGGADGIVGSNTYMLEKCLGWQGVLAEPARFWHAKLRQNRTCHISESCVWKASGERITFSEHAGNPELSTIASFSRGSEGATYDVETVSLSDLLDSFDAPEFIDYMSIDTEGTEFEILASLDWTERRFGIVTCEHNHKPYKADIRKLMESHGYVRVMEEFSRNEDWFVLTPDNLR